jgi:hypothetical protein
MRMCRYIYDRFAWAINRYTYVLYLFTFPAWPNRMGAGWFGIGCCSTLKSWGGTEVGTFSVDANRNTMSPDLHLQQY